MHTWKTRYGWHGKPRNGLGVRYKTQQEKGAQAEENQCEEQGDLNAFVPNNLFFALPATNRSGLLGRHNQCLMNEFKRCMPSLHSKDQK